MTKIPRIVVDDGHYHIVQRGNNKCDVFHDHEDYMRYMTTIRRYLDTFAIFLSHYCLMPNHIHLLVHVKIGPDLSRFMHGLNISYARYYKDKYDFVGSLWQSRYKSLHIETDAYLLQCAKYIERNPVVAKIVSQLDEYPYCSFKYYACGKCDFLVTRSLVYELSARNELDRRERYRSFVLEDREAVLGFVK